MVAPSATTPWIGQKKPPCASSSTAHHGLREFRCAKGRVIGTTHIHAAAIGDHVVEAGMGLRGAGERLGLGAVGGTIACASARAS